MKFALIFAAGLLAVTLADSTAASVVNVQPLDAFTTVMGTSGWLPADKLYSLANTSLDWVYWKGINASGQVLCTPAQGWIAPGASVNVLIRPVAEMAAAPPGTYSDQVTFNSYPRLVGDVNGDGTVDVVDLLTLVAAFGTKVGDPAYDVTCDFGGDGSVDVADLVYLVGTFGMTYGALSV
jgi:hypothetical protein